MITLGSERVNSFTPKIKKYILPTFHRETYKLYYANLVAQSFFCSSRLRKAKFFILCHVILVMRLREKFELDHVE